MIRTQTRSSNDDDNAQKDQVTRIGSIGSSDYYAANSYHDTNECALDK